MPAHLRGITARCAVCEKLAVVQLYNGRNAPMGKYCEKDGNRALRDHRKKYEQ